MNPREYCFWCMRPLPAPDAKCPVCGGENEARRNGEDQLPFALLARKYVVGHALGRGGFGITYVGLNENLGRPVAIKEFFPAEMAIRAEDRIHVLPASPDLEAPLKEGMGKALREARTVASLQSIPHVVRIFDCFARNDTVYIVMEYIEGETLAERVEKKGKLSWQEVWPLMRPIGEALGTLHAQGLVHRDVSPDNIMISKASGSSVLLDFGAASNSIGAGEKRDRVLKDGYAAPELYQESGAIDGRADEYAWAATLLYALTGKRPASALQRRFGGEDDYWKRCRREIPEERLTALRRAMTLEVDARFADMGGLIAALDIPPARKSPGRTAMKIGAAAAALCAAGSAAIGLWGG